MENAAYDDEDSIEGGNFEEENETTSEPDIDEEESGEVSNQGDNPKISAKNSVLEESKKIVDDFFSRAQSSLPPKKNEVKEVKMLLPGHGPEKQTVVVKLTNPRSCGVPPFETRYKERMRQTIRNLMLQELKMKGEEDTITKFLKAEAVVRKRKGDSPDQSGDLSDSDDPTTLLDDSSSTEEERNLDATESPPPRLASKGASNGIPGTPGFWFPYWLPYLLSNDLFYLELVCETMFGWAVPPPLPIAVNQENSQTGDGKNPSSMPILLVRGKKSALEGDGSFQNRVSFIQPSSNDKKEGEGDAAQGVGKFDYIEDAEDLGEEVKEEDEDEEDQDAELLSPEGYNETMKNVDETSCAPAPSTVLTAKVSGEDLTSIVPLESKMSESFLASNALGMKPNKTKIAAQTATGSPANVEIVAFPDANYKLYVVWEENSQQWQLLDFHPLIVEHCVSERLRRERQEAKKRVQSDEEDAEQPNPDDEEEENTEEEEEEEEEEEGKESVGENQSLDESEEDDVPSFDYDSVIVLNTLMLAALQAPSFLKTCFLQKKNGPASALSLEHVEQWLVTDEDAGFPMLATIYTGLMNARLQHNVTPLPYQLPTLHFDFNYFFQEEVIFQNRKSNAGDDVASCHRLLPGSSSLILNQLDSLTNSRSKITMNSMRALLSANVVPSRPISLNILTSPESLGLALWLLASIPERLLYVWGEQAKTQRHQLANQKKRSDQASRAQKHETTLESDDEDNDAEEEEEEEEEEDGVNRYHPPLKKIQRAEVVWRRRMQQQVRLRWHNHNAGPSSYSDAPNTFRADLTFPPSLLPGPLLFSTLVEIRCRIARERLGRKPLSYPLNVELERYMENECLEDAVLDPLVTSSFCPYIDTSPRWNKAQYEKNMQVSGANVLSDTKALSRHTLDPLTLQSMCAPRLSQSESNSNSADSPYHPIMPRCQKIYQSDLVLLLLACTNTPMPREITPLYTQGADDGFNSLKAQSQGLMNFSDRMPSAGMSTSIGSTTTVVNRVSCSKLPNFDSRGSLTSSKSLCTPTMCLQAQNTPHAMLGSLTYHITYFNSLLKAKIEKQRCCSGSSLPLVKARSGMWRLLFLLLPCFLSLRMIHELCDAAPLYELFGVNERCPLHELIFYWALEVCKSREEYQPISRGHGTGEKTYVLTQTVDIFVNAFWHELYHRLKAGLYPKPVLSFIRQCCSNSGTMLLSKVQDRMDKLQRVLSHLTGIRFRGAKGVDAQYVDFSLLIQQQNLRYRVESSLPGSSNVTNMDSTSKTPAVGEAGMLKGSPMQGLATSIVDKDKENEKDMLMKMIETTLVVASVYNEPFRSATQRLVASFKTLPMTERNIFTPDLLFELLFANVPSGSISKKTFGVSEIAGSEMQKAKKKELNFVAIRYVVVEKHVTTVRERGPFASIESPALEYAILHGYVDAAALLVSLGASLGDLVLNGSMTLETFLERCWPEEKANKLRQLWQLQSHLTRIDPEHQYGILRPVI